MAIDLKRLRELEAEASDGPFEVGIVDPSLDPAKWFYEHLSFGSGDIWCVWLPKHERSIPTPEGNPTHCVLAAITGNGPKSQPNAEYVSALLNAAPELIARAEWAERAYEMLRQYDTLPFSDVKELRNTYPGGQQ